MVALVLVLVLVPSEYRQQVLTTMLTTSLPHIL